jgi:hypothetical protein
MTQIEKEVRAAITRYQKRKENKNFGVMAEIDAVKNLYQQKGKTDEVLRACIKGGHQWCLPNARIDEAVIALRQFDFNMKFNNFEEVYDSVKKLIGQIPNVRGWLTLYDTTRRLAYLLNPSIIPNDYVYVARGARDGAKYVLGINRINSDVFRLPIADFQKLFPGISSMEIEDILCIYFHEGKFKDDLNTAPVTVGCRKKKPGRKSGCCGC